MSAENRQVGGRHYLDLKIQPMKFCMQNDWDCDAFQILRYASRYKSKDGRKDIEKAIHCVELRVEHLQMWNKPRTPWFEQIKMADYIQANEITGYAAFAMLALRDWVHRQTDQSRITLLTNLNSMLAEYPA